MNGEGYRELSDKINQMDTKLAERMAQVESKVTSEFATTKLDLANSLMEIKVSLAQLAARFESVDSMRTDINVFADKLNSTHNIATTAHENVLTVREETRALVGAHLVSRMEKAESNFKWMVTTYVLTTSGFLVFILQQLLFG